MSETWMANLRFNRADLESSSFRGARISECSFSASHLAKCDFTRSQVECSYFIFSDLEHADFSSADTCDNHFGGASLLGACFTDAKSGDGAFYFSSLSLGVVPARRNDFTGAKGTDPSDPFFSMADNGRAPESEP